MSEFPTNVPSYSTAGNSELDDLLVVYGQTRQQNDSFKAEVERLTQALNAAESTIEELKDARPPYSGYMMISPSLARYLYKPMNRYFQGRGLQQSHP